MYISKYMSLILITLLLSAVVLPVYAGAVHKWVDAQGVTHYSDQLPENISNTVKQIDLSNTYANTDRTDYQDDYYSITNQWARMREERIERKRLQLEKTKHKASLQPVVPQIVYINQAEEDRNRNVYFPAFGRRGYGFKRHNKFGNGYSNRFTSRSGASCRLPRNGYSRSSFRSRSSGLTLTIR